MYKKKTVYIGFNGIGGFRHPQGVLECISLLWIRKDYCNLILPDIQLYKNGIMSHGSMFFAVFAEVYVCKSCLLA